MIKPGDGWQTRTLLLGGTLAVLTLAGHTAAGGGVDTTGVAVTAVISLGLARALSSRPRSLPALVAILLAGQGLLHVVLTVVSGHAAHAAAGVGVPAAVMIAAHAVAAVVAAVLIGHADQVAAAWRRFTSAILGGPESQLPSRLALPRSVVPAPISVAVTLVLRHHVVRRGPPVSVALS